MVLGTGVAAKESPEAIRGWEIQRPLAEETIQPGGDFDRRHAGEQKRIAGGALAQPLNVCSAGLGSMITPNERRGIEEDRGHLPPVLQDDLAETEWLGMSVHPLLPFALETFQLLASWRVIIIERVNENA